jgi:hypothetical protein
VLRWLCALIVGGVLSGFAFLLLTGRYINDGRVVLRVTTTHGLHAGDLFVIAGWAVAMIALAVLAIAPRRRGASHTTP